MHVSMRAIQVVGGGASNGAHRASTTRHGASSSGIRRATTAHRRRGREWRRRGTHVGAGRGEGAERRRRHDHDAAAAVEDDVVHLPCPGAQQEAQHHRLHAAAGVLRPLPPRPRLPPAHGGAQAQGPAALPPARLQAPHRVCGGHGGRGGAAGGHVPGPPRQVAGQGALRAAHGTGRLLHAGSGEGGHRDGGERLPRGRPRLRLARRRQHHTIRPPRHAPHREPAAAACAAQAYHRRERATRSEWDQEASAQVLVTEHPADRRCRPRGAAPSPAFPVEPRRRAEEHSPGDKPRRCASSAPAGSGARRGRAEERHLGNGPAGRGHPPEEATLQEDQRHPPRRPRAQPADAHRQRADGAHLREPRCVRAAARRAQLALPPHRLNIVYSVVKIMRILVTVLFHSFYSLFMPRRLMGYIWTRIMKKLSSG